ncbi:MAG: hypothetical protein H8D56_18205 [Planctomycetes bacterium]|nr:hypothetical protein [Planctomycetota bacterium]MBL7143786.1 hypothetical protein [Phycisphaerae bacterium]
MVPNNIIRKRVSAGVIVLVTWGLVTGLQVDAASSPDSGAAAAPTKILRFPQDQCMGRLSVEDPNLGSSYLESGRDLSLPLGLDPKRVCLSSGWDFTGLARGDTVVPAGRNVQLIVMLRLRQKDSAKIAALPPAQYKMYVTDRCHVDPDDLSGLSELGPNDLYKLHVSSLVRTADADQRVLEPISHLTGLQILCLHKTGVTSKGMEFLKELRSLRALELHGERIGVSGLSVLKDLPELEYLDLDTSLTDAGLKHVGQLPNLRWLRIQTGSIFGPGLAELANLPHLERLSIWGNSPISDRHIKYLEGLTQLKSLTLWGIADRLTDASLASIAKLKNLEELYFIRTGSRFTPTGVAHLKELKNLKKVDFAQTMWGGNVDEYNGDEVVRQLAANSPNLESITGIYFLTAEGMKALARFRHLKYLQVGLKNHILGYDGPTGVSHLAGLTSLEELHISNYDSLSEADLASLETLGRLKKLDVGSRHLTDQGLASIGKLDQLESLSLLVVGGTILSKSGLNQLNGLTNLHYLNVSTWSVNAAKTDPADELMLDLSGLKKMKDISLSGFQLQDSDLAFLEHMPLVENIAIQPNSPLTGAFFRHLRGLPELNHLYVSKLSDCTGIDLAHLNGLPKLRNLRLAGDITDTALASLRGPLPLESITVETDEPIRKQTVADLTESHPVIEYIHIYELYKARTRPVSTPKRTRVSQPRTNQRSPANRRRERR